MVQSTVTCALWVMKVMEKGVVLMVEMDVGAKRRRGQTDRRRKKVGEAIIISKWMSASGHKGHLSIMR
jgi:hypothetical protein